MRHKGKNVYYISCFPVQTDDGLFIKPKHVAVGYKNMLPSTVISYLLVFWNNDNFNGPPFKTVRQDGHNAVRVLKQSRKSIGND